MHIGWIKTLSRRIDKCSCLVNFMWVMLIMDLCVHSVMGTNRRRSSRPDTPIFLSKITNVTVHKGEDAELECHIQNLGPKMVVWRKASEENPLTIGAKPFTPDKEISISHEPISKTESKWNLVIKSVQLKHAGVYECSVSSRGIHTHYVALNVLNKPVKQKSGILITGTTYVNRYEDIHLTCNVTSNVRDPPFSFEWFFEGSPIVLSRPHWHGRTEILNSRPFQGHSYVSELIIHRSTSTDKGNYVCRSSDLQIDNITVHILNSDKDTDKKPRAPGGESDQMVSTESSNKAAPMATSVHPTLLACLLFGVMQLGLPS